MYLCVGYNACSKVGLITQYYSDTARTMRHLFLLKWGNPHPQRGDKNPTLFRPYALYRDYVNVFIHFRGPDVVGPPKQAPSQTIELENFHHTTNTGAQEQRRLGAGTCR